MLQILIIVDVQGSFSEAELTALLPHERDHREVYALTKHGAPRVERTGADAVPVDWLAIGRAVETVLRLTKEVAQGRELHLFVGGQGPLPIFAHLGYGISKFSGKQWMIARPPSGDWALMPLAGGSTLTPILTAGERPTRPSRSTGRVALYVDTAGRPAKSDVLRDAVRSGEESLADIVELRGPENVTVTADNLPVLATELVTALEGLPASFPEGSGLDLFVAGPTSIAFATGRAVNPTVVRSVRLFNYAAGSYELTYALPFVVSQEQPVPDDPASVVDRARVRDLMLQAIEELKVEVKKSDLAWPLRPEEHDTFLAHLAALTYQETPSAEFSLSALGGTLSLGQGLLEALRGNEGAMQQRFAKVLLLHELVHEHQKVRTTNYLDVGRAGVVLEAIDFTADVFALRVLTRSAVRRGRVTGRDELRAIAGAGIDAVTLGMQAFDQREHGARIERLADRRLRRYLTWHLQRVRADYVDTAEDVETLLAATVTAELAPINARVNERYDRYVVSAVPATEFFAAVDGRLVRRPKRPGFDPADLVESVRGFNAAGIRKMLRMVVEDEKDVLLSWKR